MGKGGVRGGTPRGVSLGGMLFALYRSRVALHFPPLTSGHLLSNQAIPHATKRNVFLVHTTMKELVSGDKIKALVYQQSGSLLVYACARILSDLSPE